MSIIREVAKDHVIQYTLVMLDDLLVLDKDRVKIVHETASKHQLNIWPPFISLLNRDDPVIMHLASRLLAKLSTFSKARCPDSDLIYYLNWLKRQLSVPVSRFAPSKCKRVATASSSSLTCFHVFLGFVLSPFVVIDSP